MQINLELYRIFYIVANCGSLTSAASQLFISQPAISQSIKQLETQLGGKLFIRTNKGMELTQNGKVMYQYIKQAYSFIDQAEKQFTALEELKIGELNIGASDTIIKHLLLQSLRDFHNSFPEISINIVNRTSKEIVSLIRNGKLDIGFITLPIDTNYIEVLSTLSVSDCFVCNRKMRKTIEEPLSEEDISKKPLILLEQKSNGRVLLDKYFDSLNIELKPSMELASIDLVTEFARIGLGIGLGTREFMEAELESGELIEVPVTFELPERTIGLVANSASNLSFAAAQFIKTVTKSKSFKKH